MPEITHPTGRPPRHTDHPLHQLLIERWSPRAFSSRSIETEKWQRLMEAARWAASCSNEQPWSFIMAARESPDDFAGLLSCLVERNQVWAKNAPGLIIGVSNRNFKKGDKPNSYGRYDLGQAVAMLTVQAISMDLYLHQMAGFDPEKARATLEIPETAEAVVAIAIGYLGEVSTLPEDFQKRELEPSPRKAQSEFVFSGKWGSVPGWAIEK